MNPRTANLQLVPQTRDDIRTMIESMTPAEKAQLSADWLAHLHASAAVDPWVHGFRLVHRDSDVVVGTCSFKGPPTGGVVEIAYGVAPDQQGRGYATEAARALVAYAFTFSEVRIVRAHTLPESSASQRVLTKCGFRLVGEVVDPEDGPVWRYERAVGDDVPRAV
jgi:RimJ/RimL family protein N-acetyltransferase